jgi:hypothetical protein
MKKGKVIETNEKWKVRVRLHCAQNFRLEGTKKQRSEASHPDV